MGLFGNRKKDLWATINGMPEDTPGAAPAYDPREAQQEYDPSGQASAGPDAKPKFFGDGGVGRGIAGAIGDYLLQMNHMPAVYQPAMEHRRNLDEMQASKANDRKAEMDQWVQQQQWVRDHPNTASNDTMMDYNFILQTRGKPAADSFLDNKANPDHYLEVDDGQGGKRIINMGGQQGGASGAQSPPPPQAIARLLQNPGEAALFASKYGQAAADAILNGGGAGQAQAPRTFRSPSLFGGR